MYLLSFFNVNASLNTMDLMDLKEYSTVLEL
jgi:hypothetical protein